MHFVGLITSRVMIYFLMHLSSHFSHRHRSQHTLFPHFFHSMLKTYPYQEYTYAAQGLSVPIRASSLSL